MSSSDDELRRLNETVQKLNDRLAILESRIVVLDNQKLTDRFSSMETKNATMENQKLNDRLTAVESQRLNERLATTEAKNVALEKYVALENQKLNDRLAVVESQKLNDRIAAAEIKNATLNDRLAVVESQKLNDRLTMMEAKHLALENQKLNDRLTIVEGRLSTQETNVSWYRILSVGCAAVLFGLMGVVNYNTIPNAAEENAKKAVDQAIKVLNVPSMVETNVKPTLEKEIMKVPGLVNDSVAKTLPSVVNTSVDEIMKKEGNKRITNEVLKAVEGGVGPELTKALQNAQKVANGALPDIAKAKQEADAFQKTLEQNNGIIEKISHENRTLDSKVRTIEQLGTMEAKKVDGRLDTVEGQLGTLKSNVSWYWPAGIGCFVVLLGLIAVSVIRTATMGREVKKLSDETLEVKKLSDGLLAGLKQAV